MRIVVFGQSGQVATEVQRRASAHGASLIVLGREAADLSDPDRAAEVLSGLAGQCDAVINTAAYTAVDRAETEPELAARINAGAPAALAGVSARAGVPFLHVSTDYVFDGSGTAPWTPEAPTGPLGVYGRTKLAGEEGVRAASDRHLILRTSWVFSAHGANFVKTMLRLGGERDRLTVVADQVGGPTPAAAIADALLTAAAAMRQGAAGGTYHFAGTPDVSWAEFAREIFARAGLSVDVQDIATADWPTPARRPANSRLDCTTLARDFGIARPDWRAGLDAVLAELAPART